MSLYRCTCKAPDGSTLTRKRATTAYRYAVIAKHFKTGEWQLCSMHQRRDLAERQLVGDEHYNPNIRIVGVTATPIKSREPA